MPRLKKGSPLSQALMGLALARIGSTSGVSWRHAFNVLVAGLLTSHADSPVARILDGMLGTAFPFVLSEALLGEYRAVLVRPRLGKLHGLSEAEIDVILVDIARHAIVLSSVKTAATPLAPDSGDQFLWDLLTCRADLVLVTGDKLLLQDEALQPRVISPQTFAAQVQH